MNLTLIDKNGNRKTGAFPVTDPAEQPFPRALADLECAAGFITE
jgi:hypothetical protein